MGSTILDDGLRSYVPRMVEGSRYELLGEGSEREASKAAVGHSPCLIRCGSDGVWRAWHLRRRGE